MNVLVTSSRMPCAIDEIRKLGRSGHRVIAADTFRAAPGSHSRFANKAVVTASPRRETQRFIDDVSDLVSRERIDIVLPAFEEVFYLARYRDTLPEANWFFPAFETLARLHDKAKLLELARGLGIDTPRTVVVRNRDDLAHAMREFGQFFAKPVFSRGGVDLFTNQGPLAGTMKFEECDPSPSTPWIVQEFVGGTDVCSFSVVHEGRVTGHSTYVHPREIEHAGGIVFESIDDPDALRAARVIAEAVRYNGQMSLDFMRTPTRLVLIECNPRPTAGVHVMTREMFDAALMDVGGASLRVAPAGVRRKYSVALLRNLVLHPEDARADAEYLFSDIPDAIAEKDDLLPALYQVASYGHVMNYRQRLVKNAHPNRTLMAAYFDDVLWNGQTIERAATSPTDPVASSGLASSAAR